MLISDPQFARSEVLRVFNHAQIYLFLGAAIITAGVISSLFAVLRRRLDPLLLWFALLAVLYGGRLEMNYQLLWALGLRPVAFQRLEIAVSFLVPVPAFFFFRQLNLLGRAGRVACMVVWPVATTLAVATLAMGPRTLFRAINNGFVVIAFIIVFLPLAYSGTHRRELAPIRWGLLLFIACAVFDNVTMFVGRYYNIEPFSFVVLLVCLGFVAARRTLANEQQLNLIQRELEIAQRIQLSLLPVSFPQSPRFQVAARYIPMTAVAGDFYEFLLASNDEAGLLIADVSGHGVPAALIASMVKLTAASQRANVRVPSKLLSGMNAALCGNTQSQFVTAAYVYLNAAAHELQYSAAAHPPMLLLRNDTVVEITENGLMLAAFDFATYETIRYPIQAGDRFVLFTDGIVEAEDPAHTEFGKDRLFALVRETATQPCAGAADRIISSIRSWSPVQNDDLTVLVCDYLG